MGNRNVPHESTREKLSFLLFGWDLRTPTEAAFMEPSQLSRTSVEDYRQQVTLSLSSAHELAAESIKKAQECYKNFYDRRAKQVNYQVRPVTRGGSSGSDEPPILASFLLVL